MAMAAVVRVLGPRLTRVIAGDIPTTAATEGFRVVCMSRMRVMDAMGVPSAFAVRYLASRKVPDASPAGGVPEKKNKKVSVVSWSAYHIERKKKTYTPGACWWEARSDSSNSSMTFSVGPPACTFPRPPRPPV
jgi:hypothetical protein